MLSDYILSEKENAMLRHCIIATKNSDHERCRHGAAIWKSGHISIGHNLVKNDPEVAHKFCMGHAELRALRNIKDANNYMCLVIRIGPTGRFQMSKPCDYCELRLRTAGIKRVIYSNPRSDTNFSVMEL